MSNFEIAISVFLVGLWLVGFFGGWFKGDDEPYQSGWLSNDNITRKSIPDEEVYQIARRNDEEVEETSMQKFRRENSMREVVKRGGYLTTGERMEAMYGACEEAAMCFPDEYYQNGNEA